MRSSIRSSFQLTFNPPGRCTPRECACLCVRETSKRKHQAMDFTYTLRFFFSSFLHDSTQKWTFEVISLPPDTEDQIWRRCPNKNESPTDAGNKQHHRRQLFPPRRDALARPVLQQRLSFKRINRAPKKIKKETFTP